MKSRKSAVATAIGFAIAGASLSANANLTATTVLTFNNAGGNLSFFTMGVDPVNNITITTAISNFATSAGGGIRIGILDPASSSHSGPPNGTETPAMDNPWLFFSNTGMHQIVGAGKEIAVTIQPVLGTTGALSFTGWNVNWNGISSIPMGGDSTNFGALDTGLATFECSDSNGDAVFCDNNDNYTLDYAAHVPLGDPSGFGGVQYGLHLEGQVKKPPDVPIANPDTATAVEGIPITILVLDNDEAQDIPDPATVTITSQPALGTATLNANGSVTYTPPASGTGPTTFQYNFKDKEVPPDSSNTTTVTVTVQANQAPVAVNDSASTFAISGLSSTFDVLGNDTDPNDSSNPSAPYDDTPAAASSIVNLTQPLNGTVTVESDGRIKFVSTSDVASVSTFTYQVRDRSGAVSASAATVTVDARAFSGDFTQAPPSDKFVLLTVASGSNFTMDVAPGTNPPTPLVVTNIQAGAAGGIVLNRLQPGSSHGSTPNGTEVTGVDSAWNFFGNTGVHFTTSDGTNEGIGINGDGTLDFSGKWFVSWNSIPAINMGGSPKDPVQLRGRAAIACSPAPCSDGDSYTLIYLAHVPDGDISGFGGVSYGLNLQGKVRFIDTAGTATGGTLAPIVRDTAATLNNPDGANIQCIGDCVSFTATGVAQGGNVTVTYALAGGVPQGGVYRKFKNGAWGDFDTSGGDTIESARLPGTGSNCNGATFVSGLQQGNMCVRLTIKDGGPNDADGVANGTVVDPGGVAVEIIVPPDTRTSSTDGCSIAGRDLSLKDRGGWLAVFGFLGGLAFWRSRKRSAH